jgi:hypothetical protein
VFRAAGENVNVHHPIKEQEDFIDFSIIVLSSSFHDRLRRKGCRER